MISPAHSQSAPSDECLLPLIAPDEPSRALAWRNGAAVSVAAFLADVATLAPRLLPGRYLVNLCEDRYRFLVAYCAALQCGQTNLLPSSRAPQVVAEVLAAFPQSHCCDDEFVALAPAASAYSEVARGIPAAHVAVIGFTSGSTGVPARHTKRWDSFCLSNARNAALVIARLRARDLHGAPWLVATVPPQHMYGLETSVLLPLIGGMAVHAARPMFPADVAAALAEVPEPRVLVTTPVHLRTLVESELRFPAIGLVLCATAPLDAQLARRVEDAFETEVLELFGSTETCVIASRRTAHEDSWSLYDNVVLTPTPDGTRVEAPWFEVPTSLQDVVEILPARRFLLRGRNADLVEIAGKRASLADLTRRLLAVPGVQDAVVFQPDAGSAGAVRRVAALVVAPHLSAGEIRDAMRASVDPAFLPRPLVRVAALPRNEVGKLPRERLLAALGDQLKPLL